MRVCIVGAGTAGLCSARHALSNGLKPTVFEQTEFIGGTWRYTDEIGTDKYGLPVHTSMYKPLRTNLPKEVMGFPDFPIPEEEESYISAENVLSFLNLYADRFSVREHVKFLHHVLQIRPNNNEWMVTVKDLSTNVITTECFQFVMICNGHYHTVSIPDYVGMDKFKGKQMHSHDYRCAEVFKDETVLVIGAGPSGMDLAHLISNYAKFVTLSHHLKETPKTKFNSNLTQKPDVVSLTETGALFTDNTASSFTTILYCTGYKYSFPFLSPDCGIYVDDNCVKPLFKHCLNIKFPTMAFIGIPYYVCASQMIDIQTRFAMAFFCKRKPLPSTQEMEEDTERELQRRQEEGFKKHQAHMMGPLQAGYYSDLANTAGIKGVKPVMVKLHNASSQRFTDDLGNFRNDKFRLVDDETFIRLV